MARLTLHWLGQADQNASRLLLENIRQSGFDVLAFSTLNALLDTANEKRPGVIVLSDTLGQNETLIAITELASNPQLKGARLILAHDTGNDIACEYAMIHSFEISFQAI